MYVRGRRHACPSRQVFPLYSCLATMPSKSRAIWDLTIQKLTWHWGDSGHCYFLKIQGVLWKAKLAKPCFLQLSTFWFNLNVFSSCFSCPFLNLPPPFSPGISFQQYSPLFCVPYFCPLFGTLSKNYMSTGWPAEHSLTWRKKYCGISTPLSAFL